MAKILLKALCVSLLVTGITTQPLEIDEELVPRREMTAVAVTTQSSVITGQTETLQPNAAIQNTTASIIATAKQITSVAAPATTAAFTRRTTLPVRPQSDIPVTTASARTSIARSTSSKPALRSPQIQSLGIPPHGDLKAIPRPALSSTWNKANANNRYPTNGAASQNTYPRDFPQVLNAMQLYLYNRLQLERQRYLNNFLFGGLFFDFLL